MKQNKGLTTFITLGSLIALVAGIAAGVAAKSADPGAIRNLSPFIGLFGQLWVVVLLILILPVAGSYIFYVFLSITGTRQLGKMGGTAILIHSLNLMAGVIIGLGLGYMIIQALSGQIPVFSGDPSELSPVNNTGKTVWNISKLETLLKDAQVLLGKIILIYVISSIFISLFISRINTRTKEVIKKIALVMSGKSFRILQGFLYSLPFAVFSLLFVFSMKEGLFTAGAAGYLIVILSVLTILLFLLQYVWVAFRGGIPVREFAKAVLPVQLIAMSTRSSLATMPALLDCAKNRLGLPESISGVIIPFFVTAFRVNYSISTTFGLLFLAHIFQVELTTMEIVLFVLAQLLISFGSPGIPSGGHYFNVSLYVAVGIPVEGVLMMKAVDQIPDIFKTLLNVTEVIAVTTVVTRILRVEMNKPGIPNNTLPL